ncbi:MAG: electron transport complex subunit E [Methanosarcinales archaeon]|nr:MAG: electron transport complex subunit E [Methanosarcinales archaeon]
MSDRPSYIREFMRGILRDNPIFCLILGLCPTLAVTTSLENGLGMGIAVIFVLTGSNLIISILRWQIPAIVRIPSFIVVIATFVTVVDMTMAAFLPPLHRALGIYIPLITVNCIVLGRAEAYASRNPPALSVVDGLGIGMGFTLALVLIGSIRELLGTGMISFMGSTLLQINIEPAMLMILPPGAFFIIGLLMGLSNLIRNRKGG